MPELLAAEQDARNQYDPQRLEEQLALQEQYGARLYQDQLNALHQLDPTGTALREQLGQRVSGDLAQGYELDPQLASQLQNQIRGAQVSRGNVLGNAPASAEALYQGQAAQQMYQQRLQNAGTFLGSPTPEQQLLAVQSAQPDRSSQYANPNSGYLGQQFGLQNYSNLLAQNAASGASQTNPWATALGGAASGALAGSSFGPYGAIIGGVAGGALGYFSDEKLKENIHDVYRDKVGLRVKTFEYKDDPAKQTYLGYLAQDVKKKFPEAVGKVGKFLTVSEEFAPIPVET